MTSFPMRYLPRLQEMERLNTAGLREQFLVANLFEPDQLNLVATDLDRLSVGAAMPMGHLTLPAFKEFGTSYFTERREVGIINIGAPGAVRVGAQTFPLDALDCLYIGMGEQDIVFESVTDAPPAFYLLSCPAHEKHPTRKLAHADAQSVSLGSSANASERRLSKYIHPAGIRSCQLVMGLTELQPGSVWNTMPPHTHSRRSEIYLYFDLAENVVVHLFGTAAETRHLIVRDRQAILSPPWSLHAGAGTSNYRFIWGMAGENQSFEDIDPIPMPDLL